MKFLHIILPSKRMMETYIQMIREHYPQEDHTFYFISKCPSTQKDLFDYENVIELDEGNNVKDKIKNFYKDLSRYDCLLWHGLVLSPKFALFLFLFRHFLKKSVWIMWGIDLYLWERKTQGIKDKFINYLNKTIRKEMKNIVAIFPTDKEAYQKIFKNNSANIFYAPYPIRNSVFIDLENSTDIIKKRENGEVWIQIGNNANSFNRHLDILESLKKYRNENIRVFIPMSYGNDWHNRVDDYINTVEQKAEAIFGSKKVVVLKKLMPLEEYSKFLEQIDIMIIATDRQNALGNILKNMYAGGKVYLSEKNRLYHYFNEIGIMVDKFEDIPELTFDDFIKCHKNDNLKTWMVENYHPKSNIHFWNKLFEDMSHTKKLSIPTVNDIGNIIKELKIYAKTKEKANSINLTKYQYKRSSAELKNIVIVGAECDAMKTIQDLTHHNKFSYDWYIKGILVDELVDFKECSSLYGYNTIATIDNFKEYSSVQCAIYSENPQEREYYFNRLIKVNAMIADVIMYTSNVAANVTYAKGIYCGFNSSINSGCKFGKMVKIGNNVTIGSNCLIGDFVTIGDNCVIPNNTIISSYSILKANSGYVECVK